MKTVSLFDQTGTKEAGRSRACRVPIAQTVSYPYETAQELADVFAGKVPGYVHTRIANPTTAVLEAQLTEWEGGIGCIATASGMAAIASVAVGLVRAGDEIIAATGIFGGTVSLFRNVLERFAVTTRLVRAADTNSVADAVTDKTKLVFVETISNPGMEVPDMRALVEITRRANIPLVVDSTLTTPALVRPGELGADVVVHSTSKFINGHGTAIGGAIVDTGSFDWSNGPFEDIRRRSERVRRLAFLSHLRNSINRDLGGCAAPVNSHLMLQGLETLSVRMDAHCRNAHQLALFLREHPGVGWVNYPGLDDSPYRARVEAQFGGRGGGLLTFGLGSRDRAFRFIDSLRFAKNLANLGETGTLVIHPASTIFHEFSDDEKERLGVPADAVRVSAGIEDFEQIRADFEQAIEESGRS